MSYKQKNNSTKTIFWDKRQNKIVSSIGGWQGGKDVVSHGYSLMNELLGKKSYMQMIVLNITGRLIDTKLSQWLEGNFIGMSYPDSRIWCNQIGALAGTSQTTVVAATVAGILAADSKAYGGSKTSLIGMTFIQKALKEYNHNKSIKKIVSQARFKNQKPVIVGYARPVAKDDERIKPHEKMTLKLGFTIGKHLSLAYKLNKYLEKKYSLKMNIGGYTCAFLSDQGFTPEEVYQIKALTVSSGVTACYIDSKSQPPDSFLPLRCDDILYSGKALRALPDK
ncbi:MAG: citrate/2-methylcitrate synthase [Pseudomonadota bacterium]